MTFLSIIEHKRDGGVFTPEMIRESVRAFAEPEGTRPPDYQLAAWLMATFLRGLTPEETRDLCLAMRDSGTVLSFPDDPRPLVDKHSTGGVGDKVTLPLAPLLASLGFRVPMVSGRGLSITGGTLDKLESVPGFTAHLAPGEIVRKVQEVGCVVCSAGDLATADDHMYSLRDVTGTVDSLQLITASILSKKLAEGISALVLDVKFGSAATTTGYEASRELAVAMVRLGNDCGVNTRALLTDMEAPLGRAAGNWLEVVEAVECLEGRGPGDLRKLVVEEAASLLVQTGRCPTVEEARVTASDCLDSGKPRRKWEELLAAHGADVDALGRKLETPDRAPVIRCLRADRSGFVARCDARVIGTVVRDLGAGRLTREDTLDFDVGVDRLMKPGEAVRAGEPLLRVHARTEESAGRALQALAEAFRIADAPPEPRPLVADVIEPAPGS